MAVPNFCTERYKAHLTTLIWTKPTTTYASTYYYIKSRTSKTEHERNLENLPRMYIPEEYTVVIALILIRVGYGMQVRF